MKYARITITICIWVIPILHVNSQELITGSTTKGTELFEISAKHYDGLNNIPGDHFWDFGVVKIDASNNLFAINTKMIATEMDLDDDKASIDVNMVIFDIIGGYMGNKERNYVGIQGNLGPYKLRLELDFEPGMSAITGSTVGDPDYIPDTPYRVIITNEITGDSKILNGVARLLEKELKNPKKNNKQQSLKNNRNNTQTVENNDKVSSPQDIAQQFLRALSVEGKSFESFSHLFVDHFDSDYIYGNFNPTKEQKQEDIISGILPNDVINDYKIISTKEHGAQALIKFLFKNNGHEYKPAINMKLIKSNQQWRIEGFPEKKYIRESQNKSFEGQFTSDNALNLIFNDYEWKKRKSDYGNEVEEYIKWKNASYFDERLKRYKYKNGYYLSKLLDIKDVNKETKVIITETQAEDDLISQLEGNMIGIYLFKKNRSNWKISSYTYTKGFYYKYFDTIDLGKMNGFLCSFAVGRGQGYGFERTKIFIPTGDKLKLVLKEKTHEDNAGTADEQWSYDSEISTQPSDESDLYNIIIHKKGTKRGESTSITNVDETKIFKFNGEKYVITQ